MPEWLEDSGARESAEHGHRSDCIRAAGMSRVTRLRRVELHPWPLFDLVIRTSQLELRLPTEVELVELLGLAKQGIHDPDEMPFGFAWTDQPSPRLERSFMQYHWSRRAAWKPEEWTLDLGVWADGK